MQGGDRICPLLLWIVALFLYSEHVVRHIDQKTAYSANSAYFTYSAYWKKLRTGLPVAGRPVLKLYILQKLHIYNLTYKWGVVCQPVTVVNQSKALAKDLPLCQLICFAPHSPCIQAENALSLWKSRLKMPRISWPHIPRRKKPLLGAIQTCMVSTDIESIELPKQQKKETDRPAGVASAQWAQPTWQWVRAAIPPRVPACSTQLLSGIRRSTASPAPIKVID